MRQSIVFAVALVAVLTVGQAATIGIQGLTPTGNVTQKQSNRNLHQAMKLARRAHKLLESGLPIYQGHRVDAMRSTHAGVTELAEALNGSGPKAANINKGLGKGGSKGKRADNELRSKYTPEQVATSDKALGQAVTLIDQAIRLLDNADPTYHGERMDAIAKFKDAQKQIGTALTIK